MSEKIICECEVCKKQDVIDPKATAPTCCGRLMAVKLPKCHRPFDSESARDGEEEPCDDNTRPF